MPSPLLDSLPRPFRSAVESAGYRMRRWQAARQVLGKRVGKNRIPGPLGESLQRWGVEPSPLFEDEPLELHFGLLPDRLWIEDGLAGTPLERVLLHLPALRGFWRLELRQDHFEALKAFVPMAWLQDDTPVPAGAVIAGLGLSSWRNLSRLENRKPPVVMEGRFLTEQLAPERRINAFYLRDDKRRVVLRSAQALS